VVGGEGQVSGFRSQKSGVRSQNEEHLLSADCLLPFKGRRSGERDLRYACLLPTAYCLLHLREAGWRGLLAGMAALDKMSPPTGKEKTSNFKN